MDGLECTEILVSQLERTNRLDSEFYKKKSLQIIELLKSISASPITNLIDVSDGNHMGISNKFIEEGIPYYRGQDIHNFFIENANPICIDDNTFNAPYMHRSHLKKGDILLSIVGTIGEVALVSKDAKATCNCKLAILRPHDIKKSPLIAIYLRTKYGFDQIDKFKRGAVQMGYLLEDMNQILMPEFSDNLVKVISKAIARIKILTDLSNKEYSAAKEYLIKEIGIDMSSIVNGGVSVKTFTESFASTGRLDAEYYQPKYDYILSHIKSYKKGYFMLEDIISDYSTGYAFSSNDYSEVGVPLIRITNITEGRLDLSNTNKIPADKIPLNCKDYASENDILISMSGSIGLSCSIPNNIKVLVNQRIMRITQHKLDSNVLSMMINSFMVNEQLKRIGTGGVQTNISATDIKKIILPNIDNHTERLVANKIQKSTELLEKSTNLLKCATVAIEMSIEHDESSAITWLEEKISEL